MFPEGKDNKKDENLVAETLEKCRGGGGLVDNFTDDELKKMLEGSSTPNNISNTITRLREKKTWDEFTKDYDFVNLINRPFYVKLIIEEKKEEKKQAAQAAEKAEAAKAAKAAKAAEAEAAEAQRIYDIENAYKLQKYSLHPPHGHGYGNN